VPNDWSGGEEEDQEEDEEVPGVTWSFGPDEANPGVAITRRDGVVPDPGATVEAFLEERLESWLTERGIDLSEHSANDDDDDDYFFGLNHVVVREYDGWIAGVGLEPYGTTPECGGALIMAAVGGPSISADDMYTVFDSLAFSSPLAKLPTIEGTFESDDFALEVPEGWDAASRPPGSNGDAFRARDCRSGTNVLVNTEPLGDLTVDGEVDTAIRTYETDSSFAEFTLLAQRDIAVPGAMEAIELVYTWRSENGPVLQRQVYASDDQDLLYMTFTVNDSLSDDYAADADLLVNSLTLRGG
jgi:hypothetical protein